MDNKEGAPPPYQPSQYGYQGPPQPAQPMQAYTQQTQYIQQPMYTQVQYGYPVQPVTYSSSNVVVSSGGVQPVSSVVVTSRPDDNFVFALLTCLFCFWPTGIVALIFSCNSKDASDRMDYVKARSDGNTARTFSIISLIIGIIGIVIIIIYLIVLFTVIFSWY